MITMQPAPATINAGETARFSVTATGNTPLRYQCQKNGANISGATRPNYTTPTATAEDDGSLFSVVVMNPIGSVTSESALLAVETVTPPAIASQPASRAVTLGRPRSSASPPPAPARHPWPISGARMVNRSAGRPPQFTRLRRR